jgi:hypothetical protein
MSNEEGLYGVRPRIPDKPGWTEPLGAQLPPLGILRLIYADGKRLREWVVVLRCVNGPI